MSNTLFDQDEPKLPLAPASHTDDPQTSKEAEASHTNSGNRRRHCAVVLSAVEEHPGRTASELEQYVPYDLQETRRRLTDLRHAGKVDQGAARLAAGRTKRESTWWLK